MCLTSEFITTEAMSRLEQENPSYSSKKVLCDL